MNSNHNKVESQMADVESQMPAETTFQAAYDKDCNDHYVACLPHTLYGNAVYLCLQASIDFFG